MNFLPLCIHGAIIDSVLFGPSSNGSKSGHLQAVTNLREKQSHSRGTTSFSPFLGSTSLCYREAFSPRECPGYIIPAEGRRRLILPTPKQDKRDQEFKLHASSGAWAAIKDQYSIRLQFQGLQLKASRRSRQSSRHPRLRLHPRSCTADMLLSVKGEISQLTTDYQGYSFAAKILHYHSHCFQSLATRYRS